MLSLVQRVPSLWIALILAAIDASLYLRFLVPKSTENDFVRERIFSIAIVYILFSRFSGLILHPSASIRADLLSLLSGASSSGWIVGLVVTVLYTFVSLWRAKLINQRSLFLIVEAICSGSVICFVYQAGTDFNPFRTEDILRIIGSVILIVLIQTRRKQYAQRPQWLWGGYGLMMLLTSTYVPHIDRILILATSQWLFVLVMVIAVYAEAKHDFIKKAHRTPSELT